MIDGPPFEIRYDRTHQRLYMIMRGFWTMADVAAFATALRDTVAPLGPFPHRYDGLCDSREFVVQSSEVSSALGMIDAVEAPVRRGRLGIVVGSVMNKLQAERTLLSPNVRVFLTMDEAEQWLDSGTGET